MGIQVKKKARSVSLTDEEFALLLARAKRHGFADRNDYLLALLEADIALGFDVVFGENKERLLRPQKELNWAAAEDRQPPEKPPDKSHRTTGAGPRPRVSKSA